MHLKSHFLIIEKVLVVQKRINYNKPYIIKKQIILQERKALWWNWMPVSRVGIKTPNLFIDFFLFTPLSSCSSIYSANQYGTNSPGGCEHEMNNE